MRIGPITPNLSSLVVSSPRAVASGFELSDSAPTAAQFSNFAASDQATLKKIDRLVTDIRDLALQVIEQGPSANNSGQQNTIDRHLSEVSTLVGRRLQLGGAENAVVTGLNERQIVGYKIRQLRPNASASFSGSRSSNQRAAELTIPDAGALLNAGGRLDLAFGNTQRSLAINAGTSLAELVRGINSQSQGRLSATAFGSDLRITTAERGSHASVRVVAHQGGTSQVFGDLELSGQNVAQVSSLDVSQLDNQTPFTLTGSRDSFAIGAELTYEGTGGALVAGSATFRLTGAAGSANLSIAAGEALSAVAQRINDESGTTGVEAVVVGDNIELRSLAVGASASVVVDNVVPERQIDVVGVNASQFAQFNVDSIPDETQIILSGNITQAADTALQTYLGDAGGLVADSATFTITGELGSSQISITQGESLADVAQRVNDVSATTGVTAATNGDDLEFRSAQVGSSESVQVTLESITQYVTFEGVNPAQVTNFQVLSSQPESVNVLDATITQSSTQAQLTYTGALGGITASADFTLTGELGSASFSVNALQSLTSVRDAINAENANTGITAAVSGNTLTLTSDGKGSTAIVEVDVTSGTFNTSGGDGNGNAAGLDTVLDIDGNSVTASGSDVSYSDALGSYAFTLVADPLGDLDAITVTTAGGTFDVTGGDGSGTAYGVDAEATINGQSVVAAGNDFNLVEAGASFSGTFFNGFVGAIDSITVTSSFDEFTIVGGDGNGSALGQDGTATINGQSYGSADNTYAVNTAGGLLGIEFEAAFLGTFDDITFSYPVLEEAVEQRTFVFSAKGSSDLATFDNAENVSTGGNYLVRKDGVQIELEFAKGFSGAFDPFTVAAGKEIEITSTVAALGGGLRGSVENALTELFTLASGGEFANLQEQAGRTLSIATDALNNLSAVTGGSSVKARRSIAGSLFDQLG